MEFVVAVEDRKFKESIVEASVLEKFLKGCVFHVVGPDNKIFVAPLLTISFEAISTSKPASRSL